MTSTSFQPATWNRRQGGSVLVAAIVLLILVAGLGSAQLMVVREGVAQTERHRVRSELRQYAESGICLAIHDFDNFLTGNQGNIGTLAWSDPDDLGADGSPGTLDAGESDGIPTPGEPNLFAQPIGPTTLQAGLLVTVYPTPYEGVFRVVSTCFNPDQSFTAERVYRNEFTDFSVPSAVYVNPDIQLVFALPPGARVAFSGLDPLAGETSGTSMESLYSDYASRSALTSSTLAMDSDAAYAESEPTSGSGSEAETTERYGLSTTSANGAGLFDLLAQLPDDSQLALTGTDGTPSAAEVPFEFASVFDSFRGQATQHLIPGTYTDLDLGVFSDRDAVELSSSTLMGEDLSRESAFVASLESYDSDALEGFVERIAPLPVIYSDGDLELSGDCGEALLVVDGSLEVTGDFEFRGILVVRGDVNFTGAPNEARVEGALFVDGTTLSFQSNTVIQYREDVLNRFHDQIRNYVPLYYREQ